MSKAFTREDDSPELPAPPRPVSVLPPGAKNYLTPRGAIRLRTELERLIELERPKFAAKAVEDEEAKRQLQPIDLRIQHLQHTLQTAVVTGPPATPDNVVRFGAIVSVRDRSGTGSTYQIVGVDETDLDENRVSWLSPIAKALLNSSLGQRVRFRLPGGDEELEIVSVRYE